MPPRAFRDDEQQMPEVVAVVELREAAFLRATKEAVEGAEGHVLLVSHAARGAAELLSGQADQAMEVALPEMLGGGAVARAELINPGRNAAGGRHGRRSPTTRGFANR
jgi:hypothetical protein